MIDLMPLMRHFCQAKNLDHIYGIATNLYAWQYVFYSRKLEMLGDRDFYQMSHGYTLYNRDRNYTYSDIDMK